MYLHIGNNKNVRYTEIIGIFDIDNTTVSETTKRFLSEAQKKGKTVSICDDVPRSFVLTDENVYISQISSVSLTGRTRE